MRLTQAERKERTRSELVATARRAFLERGFHGASLDEIAEEAGYTKGAVYSNFAGKDDLYLALLDAHYEERADAYVAMMRDEPSFDDAIRAVGRFMAEADAREPDWLPTLAEFVAHVRLDLELVLRRRADRRSPRDETTAEEAREAFGGREGDAEGEDAPGS